MNTATRFAIGLIVLLAAGAGGWVLAGRPDSAGDAGPGPGRPSPSAPTPPTGPDATAADPARPAPGTAANPADPFLALSGRTLDAVLTLPAGQAAFSVPARPAAGDLEWSRIWEFQGQAGRHRLLGRWQYEAEGVLLLTGLDGEGLPPGTAISAGFRAGRLHLDGTEGLAGPLRAELERLARAALFLLRGWPSGERRGGDTLVFGGQDFRWCTLAPDHALVLATDALSGHRYPATPGGLAEIQFHHRPGGGFSAARITAHHEPDAGILDLSRLTLR